jgi:RecA-family ATPase
LALPWLITKRTVTLIQGDGGQGKTSIVQQLQSSTAVGLAWPGLHVEKCSSIGFYTEDEALDLNIRQDAIDVIMGQDCVATGAMHMFPMAGEDAELVVFDRVGNPTLTRFYQQVCEAALDHHVGLVTLDVAVDLFGGNEIMRRQVRAFIRPLHALARQIDGAVVLTSHVSGAGLQSHGGHSGSTDWSNAVRSRLYLSIPKDDGEDGAPADRNARILTRKKANHASVGDIIRLHWQDGVIVPNAPTSAFRSPADLVFLRLLDAVTREGQTVSPKPRASNNAPGLFMLRPFSEREGYQRADFPARHAGPTPARRDQDRSLRIPVGQYPKTDPYRIGEPAMISAVAKVRRAQRIFLFG